MSDFRFSPEVIEVSEGETVRFRFANTGRARHDALISEPGQHGAHDDDNAVVLDPGERGELVHAFDEPGTYELACHEPGHLEAGMRATIRVRNR